MNSTSQANVSISYSSRDTASTAVAKNVIVLALGIIINYINGALIHTFRKHQIFYVNPRYILFIHLVINDMIQLTTSISLFVYSYVFFKINAFFCCLIMVFLVFTTFNTPLNLAAMAMECYVAVCFPLRHSELWTIRRTYVLIGCIWAVSAFSIFADVFIIVATEPLRLVYATIYCERNNLFRHSFSLKKREITYNMCLVAVWLSIFYSYFNIIFAAKAAKSAAKSAAGNSSNTRNTVLLHGFQMLLCMLNYVSHMMVRAYAAWFPRHFRQVLFLHYIVIQIFPRFISPIVYGLRDKTFKQYLKQYLAYPARTPHKQ
ncbi:unnamed protein product [Ophioblennius macclurei]